MTEEEAAKTLFLMSSIWTQKVSDPTLIIWRDKLTRYPYHMAEEAVHRLADANKFFPSWAEMKEMIDLVKRESIEPLKELESSKDWLSKEENIVRIEEIRKKLYDNR